MPDFHYTEGITLTEDELVDMRVKYPLKFLWFAQNGYKPHYWQVLFHGNTNPETDRLTRFRHLVAGRRGGKTLSAAWDVIFYALHPEAFHMDVHGTNDKRPLHIWVVTKDYPVGMAALLAIRQVLEDAGLTHGKEYRENRGNRWFEFENGTLLQFKTADDPESLRGAGLDILWIDEAAFITQSRAWEVVRPALSDKLGIVCTTTTPDGKNWFYKEFWSDAAKAEANSGRVEYRSIDNPYFATEEWETAKRTMHPMLFKQEFMASFDSMAGKELNGDWLKYYDLSDIEHLKLPGPRAWDMNIYIGVDPAISLSDKADRFVITALGITKDRGQAYLLEQWAGRIPFPEQIDLITEWFQDYRPHYIGIEKVAYQEALIQQGLRIEGLPPIVPMFTRGKKEHRILAMSPLFRTGRVKIRKDHQDFINEWVDYDSDLSNPNDDCLDSMEITLRVAGVVLPGRKTEPAPMMVTGASTASDWSRLAKMHRPKGSAGGQDEHLGADW